LKALQETNTKIINTTAHPIHFRDRQDKDTIVEPCGLLLNAQSRDEIVEIRNWEGGEQAIEIVKTRYYPDSEGEKILAYLETTLDEPYLIVGSIIAAMAYPGRVLALIPLKGFERVPPSQKIALAHRFITF
jgi:hypothetical protein